MTQVANAGHQWQTCECEDCAVDRYVDYMDRRCTCCERLPCVCLTKLCPRCDRTADDRNYCADCGHWFNAHTPSGCFSGCACREFTLTEPSPYKPFAVCKCGQEFDASYEMDEHVCPSEPEGSD